MQSSWKNITDPRYLKRWITIFLTITFIALGVLFFYKGSKDITQVFSNVKITYVLLLLPLVFLDWWIGALRNHIYARRLIPDIPFKACWDANLANLFVGAITPSQSGGAPAQFYILHKYGIRISDAFSISLVNYLATMIWLPLSGWIGMRYAGVELNSPLLSALFYGAISFFSALFIVSLLSVFAPNFLDSILKGVQKVTERYRRIHAIITKTRTSIQNYRATMKDFLTGCWYMFPLTFILTILLYSNKYIIAYVILLSLGLEAPFWDIMAIQAVIFLMLYYSPSPGASGIAEFAIATLMTAPIPEDLMTVFTAGHRVFLLLLPAFYGAFVMLRYINRKSDHSKAVTA